MKDPATLDEAYDLYRQNKFQRKDFLRLIVDAIKQLQARIGGVDEAAVDDVRKRVEAMETTIGNALIGAKSDEMRRQLLERPTPRAVFVDDGKGGVVPEIPPEPRKPGRPRKEAA